MGRQRRRHPALEGIDADALAEFRAGLRRRYADDEILAELRASAARLGRSPTMREFAGDPDAGVHPQSVIEHFGAVNAAKRAAGLQPRRFISREELVAQLRELGGELGRTPTVRDTEDRRGGMASRSLSWHPFASLAAALKEAGFDVPVGEERLERAIADGAVLARELGPMRSMAEWKDARARDATLLSEWQVYRLVDVNPGAWSAFQFLVSRRLREEGVEVGPHGAVARPGDPPTT